jgi:collagenase-like PrtC family protease
MNDYCKQQFTNFMDQDRLPEDILLIAKAYDEIERMMIDLHEELQCSKHTSYDAGTYMGKIFGEMNRIKEILAEHDIDEIGCREKKMMDARCQTTTQTK